MNIPWATARTFNPWEWAVIALVGLAPIVLHLADTCTAASAWIPVVSGALGVVCVGTALSIGKRSILRPLPLVLLALWGTYVLRLVYIDCRGGRDVTSLSTLGMPEDLLLDGALVTRGLLVILVYVLVLLVGYHFAGSIPRTVRPSVGTAVSPRIILIACVACGLVGMSVWLWLLAHLGATPLSSFSESHRLRLQIASTPGLYFIRNLAIWCFWMTFWLPFAKRVADEAPFSRREVALYAVAFLALAVWTLQFGQRSYVMAPAIGVLAVIALARGGLNVKYILAFGFVAPMFSGIYTYYRNLSYFGKASFTSLLAGVGAAGVVGVIEVGLAGLSGNLETFLLVLRDYGRSVGEFQWGRTYLGLLWIAIPGSLVAGKPAYPDSWLTHLFHEAPGDPTTGLAFGVLSEHYINFGVIGILVGGIVAGALLRLLDRHLLATSTSPATLAWYGQIAYTLPISLALGGWFSVTASEILFVSLLTYGAWFVLARIPTPRGHKPATAPTH